MDSFLAKVGVSPRFARFVLVGILNTIFSYLLFALLIFVGLHYVVASTLGTIIAILFNFKTTGTVVFRNSDNRLIVRFFGVYTISYVFGISGLWVFDFLGISMYIAGAIMPFPSALLTYVLHKTFVFTTDDKRQSRTVT